MIVRYYATKLFNSSKSPLLVSIKPFENDII